LSPQERDEAWNALASNSATAAHRVMGRLLAVPEEALALCADHLQPAPPNEIGRGQVKQWLVELDSDSFARRDHAYRSLERLGPFAELALREALSGELSVEVRRRVGDLLGKLERGAPGPKELQLLRAVEVLEHLGSPARALVATLARGADEALLTQEARRALARMQP
jgi:hypothetical protein